MAKKTTRFGNLTRLGLIAALAIGTLAFDARSAAPLDAPTETMDDLFAAVAMQVPAFGGLYVDDENDTLYVYLHDGDSTTELAVMAALKAVFGDARLPQGRVQVLPAKFGFLTLKQWHERLAIHVLGLPGVVVFSIDHAKNRLVIGMENSQGQDQVEQQLAALGIPREAVDLIETGPIKFYTSLNDRHRPVVGGLEISFPIDTGIGICTLGFNAIHGGVLGFVTNSPGAMPSITMKSQRPQGKQSSWKSMRCGISSKKTAQTLDLESS